MRRARPLAALAFALCASRAPAGERLLVSNEFAGTLSVIDPQQAAVVATVPVGKRPRGLAVAPSGARAYVALTGSPVAPPGTDERSLPPADRSADGIGVLDPARGVVERVIRGVPDPEQLAIGRSGHLYAGSELLQSLLVLGADGRLLHRIRLGDEPEGVAIDPQERWACVTLEDDGVLVVVDLGTFHVEHRIAVGQRPRSIAVSASGDRVYVSNEVGGSVSVIDTRGWTRVRDVAMPGEGARPMGLALAPDGSRLYVTTGRGRRLVALDTATLAVIGSVDTGDRPWGVAVGADGSRVYVANGPSNDVAIVDAASMQVVAKVAVGERPWGVALLR